MRSYQCVLDRLAGTRVGALVYGQVLARIDKYLMRWSRGAVNGLIGTEYASNTALLRCLGAKTGAWHDVPVVVTPLGESRVLVASAFGRRGNPSWYYNLKANPRCVVVTRGGRETTCLAREAEGDERDRAWTAATRHYTGYATYQQRVSRRIPVMILDAEPSPPARDGR